MPDPLQNSIASPDYRFTNAWFNNAAKQIWDQILPQLNPTNILEIGSYEGASTCYLIDALSQRKSVEIHCVDTWEGGIEHLSGDFAADMSAVEQRFLHNTHISSTKAAHPVTLIRHKGRSDVELARLLADHRQDYFDFIYIDGSHQAPDVLCDAILSFRLLRINGIIAFDDYLWAERLPSGIDPIRCPKPAIDAFTNVYCRKLRIIPAPLYQLYVQKLSA